jgi:hypothetical protein
MVEHIVTEECPVGLDVFNNVLSLYISTINLKIHYYRQNVNRKIKKYEKITNRPIYTSCKK